MNITKEQDMGGFREADLIRHYENKISNLEFELESIERPQNLTEERYCLKSFGEKCFKHVMVKLNTKIYYDY